MTQIHNVANIFFFKAQTLNNHQRSETNIKNAEGAA